jgi:hypothetical protein
MWGELVVGGGAYAVTFAASLMRAPWRRCLIRTGRIPREGSVRRFEGSTCSRHVFQFASNNSNAAHNAG